MHLERPGFETADASVEVAPGQRQRGRADDEQARRRAEAGGRGRRGREKPGPKGAYRKYGWVLLGVAGGLGGHGRSASASPRASCTRTRSLPIHLTTSRDDINKKRDTGSNYAAGAYVGLAAGGAALAAAVILFIIDPLAQRDPREAEVRAHPDRGKSGAPASPRRGPSNDASCGVRHSGGDVALRRGAARLPGGARRIIRGLACKTDSDCYGGERCVNLVCEAPMPDLAMDIELSAFDFAHPVDGGLDGDTMDLSEVDQ